MVSRQLKICFATIATVVILLILVLALKPDGNIMFVLFCLVPATISHLIIKNDVRSKNDNADKATPFKKIILSSIAIAIIIIMLVLASSILIVLSQVFR